MKKGTLSERGQGMTEYILIVALIAVFVIGAVKLFGKKTESGFKGAANAIDTNVQDAIKHSGK